MYQSISIKKKADLEKIIGKKLAKAICDTASDDHSQKKPKTVYLYSEKPAFYLSAGDTLKAYGVDLESERITGEKYCGSEDTTYLHQAEQNGTGGSPEDGKAIFFVQKYWNGKNMSWSLSIVSKNITKQLED